MLLSAPSSHLFCSRSFRLMRKADSDPTRHMPISEPITAAKTIDNVLSGTRIGVDDFHRRESECKAEHAGEAHHSPVAIFAEVFQHSDHGSAPRLHEAHMPNSPQ